MQATARRIGLLILPTAPVHLLLDRPQRLDAAPSPPAQGCFLPGQGSFSFWSLLVQGTAHLDIPYY